MTSFETEKNSEGNSSKLNADGLTIKNEKEKPNKQATYGLNKLLLKMEINLLKLNQYLIKFGNNDGVITGLKILHSK